MSIIWWVLTAYFSFVINLKISDNAVYFVEQLAVHPVTLWYINVLFTFTPLFNYVPRYNLGRPEVRPHVALWFTLRYLRKVWKCGHSKLNGMTIWENSRMRRSERTTILSFGFIQTSCLLWKHFAWDKQRNTLSVLVNECLYPLSCGILTPGYLVLGLSWSS
jgi:hypothetical protein